VELVGRLVNPTITRHKVESFTKVKAFLGQGGNVGPEHVHHRIMFSVIVAKAVV
jgi:hypothetical protein